MTEKPQPTNAFHEDQARPVGIHVRSWFIGHTSLWVPFNHSLYLWPQQNFAADPYIRVAITFRISVSFPHAAESGIGKFPVYCCCNWLGERWQGRPRSHFCKPIASACHVTPRCEHALFLHEGLFQLHVSFYLHWMAKSSNMSASSFAWSSVNPLRKPLICFVWLLENILKAGQRFLNDIHVPRPVEGQLNRTNAQGDQELFHEDRRWTIHKLADIMMSYGVPPDLNRKSEHASHCSIMKTLPPTRPWKLQSLWLTTTRLLFPILPTGMT
jgi:hypothetical protein